MISTVKTSFLSSDALNAFFFSNQLCNKILTLPLEIYTINHSDGFEILYRLLSSTGKVYNIYNRRCIAFFAVIIRIPFS